MSNKDVNTKSEGVDLCAVAGFHVCGPKGLEALKAVEGYIKSIGLMDNERDDLRRVIAESNISDGLLDNADIDALVDLFDAWLERRTVR